MTLEPDGWAAAWGTDAQRWSTVEVGSIPTGVFYKQVDVAGPAAHSALTRVSWLGVFRTWNLTKATSSVVSSEGRAPDH